MPTPVTITGTCLSLFGSSTGSVSATLTNYGQLQPTVSGVGVITTLTVSSAVGSTFSIQLWGADQVTPANTYYIFSFKNANGQVVSTVSYQILVANGSTQDISTVTPMVTNLAPYSAAGNLIFATPNGASGTPTLRAMVLADIPAIPESKVTSLTTDLASKVPQTTTVNGHPLTSNVTVSASDLTTGTLPHGQLPALLVGDIPALPYDASGAASTAAAAVQTNLTAEVTRAETAETLLAPIASPTFTGTVTTPSLDVVGTAAKSAMFDFYNNSLGSLAVVCRTARGTPTLPTAVQTGNYIGGMSMIGYGATGFPGGWRAAVFGQALENWTDTAQGTSVHIGVCAVGTAAQVVGLTVTASGLGLLGVTSPQASLHIPSTGVAGWDSGSGRLTLACLVLVLRRRD